MRTIWKYEIKRQDVFELALPTTHKPLYVAMQYGIPHVWMLIDPASPLGHFKFAVAGTGHEIEHWSNYIGSFQMQGGALVFHLFEL